MTTKQPALQGILLFTVIAATQLSCGLSVNEGSIDISVQRFASSPLTALIQFNTDLPSSVSVTVKGLDGNDLTRTFDDTTTNHEIPVLGLYPDHTNTVVLTANLIDGTSLSDTLQIKTKALPARYSGVRLLHADHDNLSPGFVFVVLSREFGGSIEESMPLAVDNYGKIRWVRMGDYWYWGTFTDQHHLLAARQTKLDAMSEYGRAAVEYGLTSLGMHSVSRGLYWLTDHENVARGIHTRPSLFRRLCEGIADLFPASWSMRNTLTEYDLFGRDIRSWTVDGGVFHHDAIILPSGNLLALVFFPDLDLDLILEIETGTNRIIRKIDFKDLVDRKRRQSPWHTSMTDWVHPNSLAYDPNDSTIIVSARNQSAVVKFDMDPLRVRWIMGDHEYWPARFQDQLLTPTGARFQWQWGQHAPMLSPSDPDRILLFDNGNHRSHDVPVPAASNFSRAVEYRIDEASMTVEQVWQYGEERGSELYSPVVGNAVYLENGNKLICFGAIARDSAGVPVEWVEASADSMWYQNRRLNSSARILETSGDYPARVYFELAFEDNDSTDYIGYLAYRAYRWP